MHGRHTLSDTVNNVAANIVANSVTNTNPCVHASMYMCVQSHKPMRACVSLCLCLWSAPTSSFACARVRTRGRLPLYPNLQSTSGSPADPKPHMFHHPKGQLPHKTLSTLVGADCVREISSTFANVEALANLEGSPIPTWYVMVSSPSTFHGVFNSQQPISEIQYDIRN